MIFDTGAVRLHLCVFIQDTVLFEFGRGARGDTLHAASLRVGPSCCEQTLTNMMIGR